LLQYIIEDAVRDERRKEKIKDEKKNRAICRI